MDDNIRETNQTNQKILCLLSKKYQDTAQFAYPYLYQNREGLSHNASTYSKAYGRAEGKSADWILAEEFSDERSSIHMYRRALYYISYFRVLPPDALARILIVEKKENPELYIRTGIENVSGKISNEEFNRVVDTVKDYLKELLQKGFVERYESQIAPNLSDAQKAKLRYSKKKRAIEGGYAYFSTTPNAYCVSYPGYIIGQSEHNCDITGDYNRYVNVRGRSYPEVNRIILAGYIASWYMRSHDKNARFCSIVTPMLRISPFGQIVTQNHLARAEAALHFEVTENENVQNQIIYIITAGFTGDGTLYTEQDSLNDFDACVEVVRSIAYMPKPPCSLAGKGTTFAAKVVIAFEKIEDLELFAERFCKSAHAEEDQLINSMYLTTESLVRLHTFAFKEEDIAGVLDVVPETLLTYYRKHPATQLTFSFFRKEDGTLSLWADRGLLKYVQQKTETGEI